MKVFRGIWVLLTNGTAVYLLYRSYAEVALLNTLLEQGSRNRTLWLGFTLRACIPVLGILFELFGLRFAKWINFGYFLLIGVGLSAIGILARSDHHALPFLVLGPAALLVAGVNWLFYRRGQVQAKTLNVLARPDSYQDAKDLNVKIVHDRPVRLLL